MVALALIRGPIEEEKRARHWSRQRQLVHHRQKIEAQDRGLLVNHGSPPQRTAEAAELEPTGQASANLDTVPP
jgi:hypothetical protein